MSDVEVWAAVPGYGNYYEASTHGRVRAKARAVEKRTRHGGAMVQFYSERLLNPTMEKGYLRVHLGFDGRKVKAWVHSMVLRAFEGEPSEGQICRHLDGVRTNNAPSNLAWGSHSENMADRKLHGNYLACGEHVMAKLTPDQVEFIRASSMTGAEISRIFGIGQSQVSRIRKGQSWKAAA
jgi:hypothetical protein